MQNNILQTVLTKYTTPLFLFLQDNFFVFVDLIHEN